MVSRFSGGEEPARGLLGNILDILNPAVWILGPLVLWEIAARGFRLPDYILPLPSQVAVRLVVDRDTLLLQAGRSSILIVEGFLVGAIPGVLFGLLMASARLLEKALYPLIVFVQTTPQIAIAPLLIVSGCKISLLISVTVVIVVEFLSSNEGLGYVAVRALSNQDLPLMFAAIFVAIGIGLAFSYLVDLAEWLLMPWVRVQRRAG